MTYTNYTKKFKKNNGFIYILFINFILQLLFIYIKMYILNYLIILIHNFLKDVVKIKKSIIPGITILSVITIAMLFSAEYTPLTLIFLFITSITGGICILRYKTVCYLMSYIFVSVTTLFIIPDVTLLYIALFGIYPIVKLYIEKSHKILIEYIMKFIYWNISLVALYIIIRAVDNIYLWDFNGVMLWFVGIILLAFYDIMFSLVINALRKMYSKYL